MLKDRLNLETISATEQDLLITFSPEAFKLCKQKVLEVEEIRQIGYWVGEELIANAMISSGDFSEKDLITKVTESFSMGAILNDPKYSIEVSCCLLPACREYQDICTNYFKQQPSLETVINALFLTGKFDPKLILEDINYCFSNPIIPLD